MRARVCDADVSSYPPPGVLTCCVLEIRPIVLASVSQLAMPLVGREPLLKTGGFIARIVTHC